MELQVLTSRYWRGRRYERLDGDVRSGSRRCGRLRRLRKLRRIKKLKFASPLRLWRRFKDAYVEMMLRLAGSVGGLNSRNVFGAKPVPRAIEVKLKYSKDEFETRIVLEFCKSLAASRPLGSACA